MPAGYSSHSCCCQMPSKLSARNKIKSMKPWRSAVEPSFTQTTFECALNTDEVVNGELIQSVLGRRVWSISEATLLWRPGAGWLTQRYAVGHAGHCLSGENYAFYEKNLAKYNTCMSWVLTHCPVQVLCINKFAVDLSQDLIFIARRSRPLRS